MSASLDNELTAEVATEIENYLERNPQAADNVEGVYHWWISSRQYGVSVDVVQGALDQLEALGKVERTWAGGTHIYRKPLR